ncbi:very long-chain acyl-CoA synthetase-like [Anneissia japonica]|uniref:very long-chain acyl-CoA synthetase-like n=1 Tax=Anneissia japonica TaxID=1529436 RepID=UPI0014255221|nr:very long-chain acyl-CoA synthetase-like [Anneissia japonica]
MDKSQAKLIGLGGTAAIALYLQRKYGSALLNDVRWIRIGLAIKKFALNCEKNGLTLVDLFLQNADSHPYKPCILFQNSVYTYGEIDIESNKVAHFAKGTGYLDQNDTVAFFMKNEPAYCWWFLGLQKIGITCAFINYNLRGKSLLHCIKISGSKAVVVAGETDLVGEIIEILPELSELGIRVWLRGNVIQDLPDGIQPIEHQLQSASGSPAPKSYRSEVTLDDQAYYIFTSGTTGLPKACKKTHRSNYLASFVFDFVGLRPDDVLYSSLPLYHSAAFSLGFLNCMRVGCTFAIGRKFSVTRFWEDVRKHHVTFIQYIGEVCRYLLAQPKKPDDGVYPVKLRIACGNGLRPDIWEEFKTRFNIEHIYEFWGATEGNHMFLNLDGKIGPVGRLSPLMKLLSGGVHVIKCDVDLAEPIRGKNGKCIEVSSGLLFCRKIQRANLILIVMDKSQAKLIGLGGTAAIAVYLQRKYGSALLHDFTWIRRGLTVYKLLQCCEDNGMTVLDLFLHNVDSNPYKPCILFHNSVYTYKEVDFEANKVAHFVKGIGYLDQHDTVAFFMKNEPAYCWWFLGLQKTGVTCAFINYNLREKSLLHCIKVSGSKVLVCAGETDLIEKIIEILPKLRELGIRVWLRGNVTQDLPGGIETIEHQLQSTSGLPAPNSYRSEITLEDEICYIFTSGTTGFPKACKKTHRSINSAAHVMIFFGLRQDDVFYTPLPMYHISAIMGFVNSVRVGCTFASSRMFSVTHFWEDVRKHHATVIQYIGETCRYLLAQPKKPDDGVYPVKLRIACGNGLRPDIWEQFKTRFNIERIVEYWGATEANTFFMNIDGKIGAVGRLTPLVKLRTGGVHAIKCDVDLAEPIRGKDGKCIEVAPGETGLFVSLVNDARPFLGYTGKIETEKKILRNVFQDGDCYFNTGDLIKIDSDGYVYFMDRLGDTFRWKGENVSTTEVAKILDEFPGIMEANVYGVAIPGQDGKAGMAAITLSAGVDSLDFKKLYTYLSGKLPSYARPKFIRITSNMDLTVTFKHKKSNLVKQGFDPIQITDPLFYVNNKSKTYDVLNADSFASVIQLGSKL